MSNINLAQFINDRTEKTPDKIFLQFKDQKITYQDFYERIAQSVKGFSEIDIKKGDKVGVMLNNSPEYLDVWFGLSFSGAVLVPINVHLKGESLKYILNHSDCKVIIAEEKYMNHIEECLPFLSQNIQVILHTTVNNNKKSDYIKLKELITNFNSTKELLVPDFSGSSLNSILYTSGTTGMPKGVMLSHEAYINSAIGFAENMMKIQQDDILFTTLPLFHINAQAHTVLGGLHTNSTVALSEGFSASLFWDEIRDHQATIFNSLGAMIPILSKQPEKEDDHDNPARLTACAATPKEFWREFEKRFNVKIIEGYGLTETTGFCISNSFSEGKTGSMGKPLPVAEARISNENQESLPRNELGEIQVRTSKDNVFMKGYYKMPDKTKESMLERWFRTGDLGHMDEDGFIYFSDRLKGSIRRRGENISSWEVEKVINIHPKVLESAVIGVPSEVGEEDVMAFIILKKDATLPYEALVEWCEDKMAYFKVPRYIQYIDNFPKTATERVQKFKLEELGITDAWDREKEIGRFQRK